MCLSSLTSIVRNLLPSRVFWVHDRQHHPQRLALYPQYKEKQFKDDAEREESEQYREVYHAQRDLLLSVLPYFGVHVINGPYESDDSIWYLTNVMTQYKIPSVIVTEDRDFTQVLSDMVWIYAPHKEKMITLNNWADFSKWSPSQVVLAKAILGDPSDNIPSPCKGLGPTGLKKLLMELPDNDVTSIARVVTEKFDKKKKYESLLDAEIQAQVSRNMQLISFNAGLTFTDEAERNYVWAECCAQAAHSMQAVMQFLARYEMNQLLRTYGLWTHSFGVLV
jgi:5'-3' exonuclease